MKTNKYEKVNTYRLNKFLTILNEIGICGDCPIFKKCNGYNETKYGKSQCRKKIKNWIRGW